MGLVILLGGAFLVIFQQQWRNTKLRAVLKKSKANEYAEKRQIYANLEAKWEIEEKLLDVQCKWQKLVLGIQKHMNAKGHDRCWLNDLELYELVDPKYDRINMSLPCLPEFISNCCIYWRDNQPPEVRNLGG